MGAMAKYMANRFNLLNWIRRNQTYLTYVVVIGVLVFAAQLGFVFLLPMLATGRPLGIGSSAAMATLLSMMVVLLIFPVLLRLNQRAQRAEKGVRSTNDGYWVLDSDGHFVEINDGYCRMMGYTRDEVMAMCIADFEEFATMPAIQGQIKRIMAKGNELFETRHRHRSGHWVYLEIAVTVVDSHFLVAFLRDVTLHKEASRAMQEATRLAQAASEAKSLFLANMSHEIRTPMNGVLGMTDLVLHSDLEPEQREHLSIIKSSAESLLVILNDVLDFSKIEAGRMNIESIPFSVTKLVEDALASLTERARGKGLDLSYRIEPSVPSVVLGDPGRVRQVIVNLCDNAIKFTAQGGITIKVDAAPSETGLTLRVSVRDTGIGIDASKQQSIFEAFSQADNSTTRQFGGTGLGLTICGKLVELMGGKIAVESEPGSGSEFVFTVQVGAVPPVDLVSSHAVDAHMLAATDSLAKEPHTRHQNLRILLVEDHPVNQRLAITLLEKWGHEVVLAENGQEALDQFEPGRWDLILMDIQMPVMGGMEATRLIRAKEGNNQRVPIIALTANAMDSDRQACLAADMDEHLGKPYTRAGLQDAIDRTLKKLALQL